MILVTLCPNCHAAFRVVPDQLKIRRGLVRCGACRHVFSGIDGLRSIGDPEAAPVDLPESPSVGAPVVSNAVAASAATATHVSAAAPTTDSPLVAISEATEPPSQPMGPAPSSRQALIEAIAQRLTENAATPSAEPPTAQAVGLDRATLEPGTNEPRVIGPGAVEETMLEPAVVEPAGIEQTAVEATDPELVEIGSIESEPAATQTTQPEEPLAPAADERAWPEPQLDLPDEPENPVTEFKLPPADEPSAVVPRDTVTDRPLGESLAIDTEPDPLVPEALVKTDSGPHLRAGELSQRTDAQRIDLDFLDLPASPDEPDRPAVSDRDGTTLARRDFRPFLSAHLPPAVATAEPRPSDTASEPMLSEPLLPKATLAEPTLPAPGLPTLNPPQASASDAAAPVPQPATPDSPAVDFFASGDKVRGFRSRLSLLAAVGSMLLLVGLTIQLGLAWRDALSARVPALAEPMRLFASIFGLQVQPPRDLEALALESFELQSDSRPGQLRLAALIRNQSDAPVRWPAMELTLSDAKGGVVVRKVLLPRDYLGGEDTQASLVGVPSGKEQAVQIALSLTGPAPASYNVKLFYP